MLAEHQRVAADRAVHLLRTRGGLLLADEAGLGKSFVAAEVIRRMEAGADLIVPAALVGQWRETVDHFAVETRILTHDGVVSDPFLPQPSDRIVVVDEAHAFRNPQTQRYGALARRTAGRRVLLITATPVCNSSSDLEALIRLIARDDLCADLGVPSIDAAFARSDADAIAVIGRALMIRRDRSVLSPELQFGVLQREVLRHPVLEAPQIETLQFPLVGRPGGHGAHAVLRTFLRRRLESSEAALIESLGRQLRFYRRVLDATASGHALPKRDYRRAFAHEIDSPVYQDVLFWDLFASPGEVDPRVVREEMARIDVLIATAKASPCEKRVMLVQLLKDASEPALIFTGAIATARDLQSVLGSGLVTSGERSREAVLHAFRTGRLDVVVSTDMAAEGLNLQRAGMIVHYDLPWNPVKLDQRNGRAFRIGQKRPSVRAVYFVPFSRSTGIVETITRKNRLRRRLLAPRDVAFQSLSRTLRPRLTSESAFTRLHGVSSLALPEVLARRHKAGIELLMLEMSREYLDARRIADLVAIAESEA